jgi:hypothetical protein
MFICSFDDTQQYEYFLARMFSKTDRECSHCVQRILKQVRKLSQKEA